MLNQTKQQKKISETKPVFDKMSKVDKTLARFIKEKEMTQKSKIRNER